MALNLEFTPVMTELSLIPLGNLNFWHFNSLFFVYVNMCLNLNKYRLNGKARIIHLKRWMCFSFCFLVYSFTSSSGLQQSADSSAASSAWCWCSCKRQRVGGSLYFLCWFCSWLLWFVFSMLKLLSTRQRKSYIPFLYRLYSNLRIFATLIWLYFHISTY